MYGPQLGELSFSILGEELFLDILSLCTRHYFGLKDQERNILLSLYFVVAYFMTTICKYYIIYDDWWTIGVAFLF